MIEQANHDKEKSMFQAESDALRFSEVLISKIALFYEQWKDTCHFPRFNCQGLDEFYQKYRVTNLRGETKLEAYADFCLNETRLNNDQKLVEDYGMIDPIVLAPG